MALPVRVNRGTVIDPLVLVRNDFDTMLTRLLGRRAFGDEIDGMGATLGSLANYGVDIREDANHVYVVADLPGFRKEDVDISMENGTLTITADRREEVIVPPPSPQDEQAGGDAGNGPAARQRQASTRGGGASGPDGEYHLRERRIQRFVRSFTLPPNVDERNVQAKLEDGVLTITLDKREESKPKRIAVS